MAFGIQEAINTAASAEPGKLPVSREEMYQPPLDFGHARTLTTPGMENELLIAYSSQGGTTQDQITFAGSKAHQRLSMHEEKYLDVLIMKQALGTITPQERAELEELDRRRGLDEPSSSAKTIEARERLLSKMDELLTELTHFGRQHGK